MSENELPLSANPLRCFFFGRYSRKQLAAMATSLLEAGEVTREDLPPIAKRLIPRLADKPKLFHGLDSQGYVIVNSVTDDYIGYSDDSSVGQSIEFRSEDYGDACIDLSRSFVSVTFRTEVTMQGTPGWRDPDVDWPVTLANGGGQLLFSRCTTELNNSSIEDQADATEDGPALSGFVQMITMEEASRVRGGRQRVLGVPAMCDATGVANPPGFYYAGGPAGVGVDINPRCISSEVGQVAPNDEGWSLCDDFDGDVGVNGDVTYGENSVYPVGQSRGGAANMLRGSFAADGTPQCTVRFRPSSSIWRQKLCLPAGSRINLRCYKSAAQRFIHSQWRSADLDDNQVTATRAYWERATLWLWVVRPGERILREIQQTLAAEKFLIPLTARRIWAAQPVEGTASFAASGLFPGVQPARLWVWLTRSHQQSGMSAQNLARYSPYAMGPFGAHDTIGLPAAPAAGYFPQYGYWDQIPAITYAVVTTPDGRQYPENPFDSNLAVVDAQRRYAAYLSACDNPLSPALSFRAFQAHYPVLCIDINPQTTGLASGDADTALGVPLRYSEQGMALTLQFDGAVDNTPAGASDTLPPLWVVAVAESTAGLLLSGGPLGLADRTVRAQKIGY